MQRAVARHQLRAFRPRQFAEGVGQRLDGQRGIEPGERIAQPLREDHLAVVSPLGHGHVRRDIGAVRDPPATAFEPGERGLFDDGFGEGGHRLAFFASGCCALPRHKASMGNA